MLTGPREAERVEQSAATRIPQQWATGDDDDGEILDRHVQFTQHRLGVRGRLEVQPLRRQPVAGQHLEQPSGIGWKRETDQG